eukprot:UN26676
MIRSLLFMLIICAFLVNSRAGRQEIQNHDDQDEFDRIPARRLHPAHINYGMSDDSQTNYLLSSQRHNEKERRQQDTESTSRKAQNMQHELFDQNQKVMKKTSSSQEEEVDKGVNMHAQDIYARRPVHSYGQRGNTYNLSSDIKDVSYHGNENNDKNRQKMKEHLTPDYFRPDKASHTAD